MKEHVDLNLDKWVRESCFMSALTSDSEEPKTFSDTWNHQEPKSEICGEKPSRKS